MESSKTTVKANWHRSVAPREESGGETEAIRYGDASLHFRRAVKFSKQRRTLMIIFFYRISALAIIFELA